MDASRMESRMDIKNETTVISKVIKNPCPKYPKYGTIFSKCKFCIRSPQNRIKDVNSDCLN
jgi:hypothetical protein